MINKLMGIVPNASEHGPLIDHFLEVCHWFMAALFVGWTAYFFYTIWRFNAKRSPKANYHGVKSKALANSHIGDRLGGNRAALEQVSQNILTALETHPLPGVTPAKIAALQAQRQQYLDSELDQTGAGGDASTARKQAKARLDALVEKRQKIQFAADAIWPWHDPAHVGLRKEFELPATRPYAA